MRKHLKDARPVEETPVIPDPFSDLDLQSSNLDFHNTDLEHDLDGETIDLDDRLDLRTESPVQGHMDTTSANIDDLEPHSDIESDLNTEDDLGAQLEDEIDDLEAEQFARGMHTNCHYMLK